MDISDKTIKYIFDYTAIGNNIKEGILDIDYIKNYEPLQGLYNAGTIGKFNNENQLVEIKINDDIIHPEDKGWDLAKIFFLSNVVHDGLYSHGTRHYTNVIFAAITYKYLSKKSPIYKLLKQHFKFTSSYDQDLFSIVYSQQNNPVNAFAYATESALKISGILNDNNKKYDSINKLPDNNTEYRKMINDAYDVINNLIINFMSKNKNLITKDVKKWADKINEELPYFPNGDNLDNKILEKALTYIIHNASIRHSLDHN